MIKTIALLAVSVLALSDGIGAAHAQGAPQTITQ